MLDRLSPNPGSRRPRRRKGRGNGSGLGKTAGRGQKGAGARSGRKHRAFMEGGQMPLARRLPKFGFYNRFRKCFQIVNVRDLGRFEAGATVDLAALAAAGLVRQKEPVKLLAEGEIAAALTVRVDAASAAARNKVESAGGKIEFVSRDRAGAEQK